MPLAAFCAPRLLVPSPHAGKSPSPVSLRWVSGKPTATSPARLRSPSSHQIRVVLCPNVSFCTGRSSSSHVLRRMYRLRAYSVIITSSSKQQQQIINSSAAAGAAGATKTTATRGNQSESNYYFENRDAGYARTQPQRQTAAAAAAGAIYKR